MWFGERDRVSRQITVVLMSLSQINMLLCIEIVKGVSKLRGHYGSGVISLIIGTCD